MFEFHCLSISLQPRQSCWPSRLMYLLSRRHRHSNALGVLGDSSLRPRADGKLSCVSSQRSMMAEEEGTIESNKALKIEDWCVY